MDCSFVGEFEVETPISLFCLDVAGEQALIFFFKNRVCVCVRACGHARGGNRWALCRRMFLHSISLWHGLWRLGRRGHGGAPWMPWNAKPVELENGELPAVSLEKREPGRSFLFPGLKSWSLPGLCRRGCSWSWGAFGPASPTRQSGWGGQWFRALRYLEVQQWVWRPCAAPVEEKLGIFSEDKVGVLHPPSSLSDRLARLSHRARSCRTMVPSTFSVAWTAWHWTCRHKSVMTGISSHVARSCVRAKPSDNTA